MSFSIKKVYMKFKSKKKNIILRFETKTQIKGGTYIFNPQKVDQTGHYYAVIYNLNNQNQEVLELTNIIKIILYKNKKPLRWIEVINLWKSNSAFNHFFTNIINECIFTDYFFECPGITLHKLYSQIFEFRLINHSKSFPSTDLTAFEDQKKKNKSKSILVFGNLSQTSILIIPNKKQKSDFKIYNSIGNFLKGGTNKQINLLFSQIGVTLEKLLQDNHGKKVWLSTHGLGVHWLHFRLDFSPKYYQTDCYK